MERYTILHTIETGGPGGAETVLVNLASRIDRRRFRSLALVPNGTWLPQKLRDLGVQTCILESRHWFDPRMMARMAELIIKEKVDLVHSHLPDQNFYSCLAGKLTGRKTITTYHGPVELAQLKGLKGSLKGWVARHWASANVVVCDFVGNMLRATGFPKEKIVRIYNGVDLTRCSGPPSGTLRTKLGCNHNFRLIGTVANIRPPKGYEFFIRAARKVIDRRPDARFVSMGDFHPTFGPPLLSLVRELGLEGRFIFLGFHDEAIQLLKDLDVFVLPSVSEGFPLVSLEAMAAGKPIVATRCGGLQEVVEDGRTGLLVPPADPESLAEKILELLNDPDRAARMAARAREKALADFSLEGMVHNYEALYERILNPS